MKVYLSTFNFHLSTNKVFQFFEGDAAFVQSLTENNGRYADNFQMAYIIGTAYASTGYQIEFRMVLQYLLIQRYRWSLQHSVTTDISTDNLTDPLLYIVFQERKQFAEAEAKIEYYQKQLVEQLSNYRVQMPERWIGQTAALLDKREMVEIRHELIQRRQALRKQMDYNQEVAETARNEVKDVAAAYPRYAKEILSMVERYDR